MKERWTVKFGLTAFFLKLMLLSLSRHQRLLIRAYQGINFNKFTREELIEWAEKLEKILERGRPTLARLERFGPRTQKLWGSVLSDLSEQLDHIDSIANSLRSAANTHVSLLLAAAADYMAASTAAKHR